MTLYRTEVMALKAKDEVTVTGSRERWGRFAKLSTVMLPGRGSSAFPVERVEYRLAV